MSVKWGVLGTAGIAAGCTVPGMLKAKDCEVYAIAGRDAGKVQEFQKRFGFKKAYVGYEELLADPDVQAVYIPLPNGLHYEWVMKALKAGKHVLCEKPLALSAAQAEEMYATAEENGVILTEAFAYLHSPYVKALKEEIQSGSIGKVDYIEAAFVGQKCKPDNIRLVKELGGGAMYDLGCYCSSMILSLTDGETEYVKANAEMDDNGIDLCTSGIVKFDNGVRASFNVGMVFEEGSNGRFDRLYVHGTKGYIKSDVEFNQAGELSYTVMTGGKKQTRNVSARQNYTLEVEHMNRMILEGAAPEVTPAFSVRNARFIDEVLQAIGY